MQRGIRFEVGHQDRDVIEVHVTATNGAFAGETYVYLHPRDLAEAPERLRGFPKSPSDVRELTFAPRLVTGSNGLVSMRLSCLDAAGHPSVECHLEAYPDGPWAGMPGSVTLSFAVDAAAVDSFVLQLCHLGAEGTAVLEGAAV
jgi:hypothetical protein